MSRRWSTPVVAALAVLVLFRVGFALAVLASSPGRLVAGLPRFHYAPLAGDAYGYYYCVREILASIRREAAAFAAVTLVGLVAVVLVWRRTRNTLARTGVLLGFIAALSTVVAAAVRFTGAAQLGWPLIVSVPFAPTAAAFGKTPGVFYAVALVLSLVANAVVVVATYELARSADAGDAAALGAAALFAFWPLIALLTGPHAAWNGSWQDDVGLSAYTEPASTALVVVALLLVVRRPGTTVALIAGSLLGLATLVRLSNVLIAGCVVLALALRRERARAAAVAGGAALWAPAVLAFWPKGYPKLNPPVFPAHPFELSYAHDAWAKSYLWHPAVLLVLVPVAAIGVAFVSRRARELLVPAVLATAAFYTFYEVTPIHPRFLFVVLPPVLVLWAAGAVGVAGAVAYRLRR